MSPITLRIYALHSARISHNILCWQGVSLRTRCSLRPGLPARVTTHPRVSFVHAAAVLASLLPDRSFVFFRGIGRCQLWLSLAIIAAATLLSLKCRGVPDAGEPPLSARVPRRVRTGRRLSVPVTRILRCWAEKAAICDARKLGYTGLFFQIPYGVNAESLLIAWHNNADAREPVG